MSADEATPLDLSALAPRLDVARREARIAAILQASHAELARRQRRPSLALVVVEWRRPVMSLAALAAAAAVTLFVMPARSAATATATFAYGAAPADSSVASLLGVPADYAGWVEGSAGSTSTRSAK